MSQQRSRGARQGGAAAVFRRLLPAVSFALALAACSGSADRAPVWPVAPAKPAEPTVVQTVRVAGDDESWIVRDAGTPIELTLGDRIERTVDVWVPEGRTLARGAVARPDVPDGFLAVESARLATQEQSGGAWHRAVEHLRAVGTLGEVELPARVVRIRRSGADPGAAGEDAPEPSELTVPAVAVRVAPLSTAEGGSEDDSLRGGDPAGEPALWAPDPHELRRGGPWWGLIVGLSLLAAALLGGAWWWFAKKPGSARHAEATPLPAHVLALRELSRLRAAPRTTPDEVEALYVGVSAVLRKYFEERFGLRAPDRTTEEFLPEVERRALLDGRRQDLLREFLEACDLVKFAGSMPRPELHERVLSIAEQIVEATREDGTAPAEARAASASALLPLVPPVAQQGGVDASRLPDGVTLLDPWFLALGVVLVGLAWFLRVRRRPAALSTASSAIHVGLPRSLRQRLAWLPLVLQLCAAIALSVALARPAERTLLPDRTQGVDILILLDRSSSMLTPDMVPGKRVARIEVARERAEEFALARTDDRVGIMTFALFPELLCPLTLDHEAVAAYLRGVETVEPRSPEDRTGIGVALADAARVLEESAADSRVVVLLTDGANNIDSITPVQAAKFAADAGCRVYTIGVGRPQEGLFGPLRPDWSELEDVAETTGGAHFVAESASELGEVYARIDELERVPLDDPRYAVDDLFAWPLALGALLLALAWLLDWLWIREVPA
jgi:Ca-activated chloride channel family protein